MSFVTVRVLRRGSWHVDLTITDPAHGSAAKIAAKLRGDGYNARVDLKEDVVVIDASS